MQWLDHVWTYLSGSNEYGSDDVSSMSIESSDGPSHGRPHQILANVQINQGTNIGLQDLMKWNAVYDWNGMESLD